MSMAICGSVSKDKMKKLNGGISELCKILLWLDKDKVMVSILLSFLYVTVISSAQIRLDFVLLLEAVDDLAVDTLDVVEVLTEKVQLSDKFKFLSQLFTLLIDIGLHIWETHVFSLFPVKLSICTVELVWKVVLLNGGLSTNMKIMPRVLTVKNFCWISDIGIAGLWGVGIHDLAWKHQNPLKLCAGIHISLGLLIQLLGVRWFVRNSLNLLWWLGANFCIILERFSAMAITWNSLHDGMDASAKSWEQELYLTLVTGSYGRGANAIWESSDFACIHLSQLLAVVRHHHGYARHQTYWLESYLSSIDRAAILQLFGVVQGYLKKWNFAFSAGLHAWVALVVCTCTKDLKEGIYSLIFEAIRCSELLDLLINNLSVEDCKDLAMSNSSKASRTEDTCVLDEIETRGGKAYNTGSFSGMTHAEDRDSSQAKLWDPGGVQQRLEGKPHFKQWGMSWTGPPNSPVGRLGDMEQPVTDKRAKERRNRATNNRTEHLRIPPFPCPGTSPRTLAVLALLP
jgi:hypothetical protein